MLLPRLSGLSPSKILHHKHLLDNLILVFIVSIPHDIDDVISGKLDLCWSGGGVFLFLNLGSARPRVVSWNTSGTVTA